MSTGQRRIGKYELYELLGRGGMAEVWKAFDPNLQRYVAIKILHADLQNDSDFIKRFEREARVIASLRHPHIVPVHDFQLADPSESGNTRAYMVMKYIEGPTLTEYIRRTSRAGNFPPVTDLVHLFTSVGAAIDYAHQHGMIHRDIKPSNIMLDKGVRSRYQIGEPVLTDFGIVKLMGASTGTLSGWWIGTPAYISPEQAQGHQGNERSDIYSLGVILYEICTGVRPFLGDSPVSIIMQHISAAPTLPQLINPRVSPALSEVILRGLAKDPDARFPTASSLATALGQALGSSSLGTSSVQYGVDATPAERNRTPVLPTDTPSSPSSAPRAALSTPQFAAPLESGQKTSMTPPGASRMDSIAGSSDVASPQTTTPSLLPSDYSPRPLFAPGRRRVRVALFIALFIFVLVGSNLFTFYLSSLLSKAGAAGIVGQAYFVSSGQASSDSRNGINDEVQIDLHNIPTPASGNSYYAWLLGDEGLGSIPAVLLGKLSVEQGEVHFLYPGDAQHDDLIAKYSQFLITEESANGPPNQPSSDHSTWRFFNALPQAQSLTSCSLFPISGLQAMRNILYQIPDLAYKGIQSSLEMQVYQNTRAVSQLADAASLTTDPNALHTQVVDILNYLVGTSNVQADVGSSSLPPIDTRLGLVKIPLIDLVPGQSGGSYLDLLNQQVGYIQSASGVATDASILAHEINQVLANVELLLKKLHQDTVTLARLSASDLLQSSTRSILDRMAIEASEAFYGYLDSPTGKIQEGVVWIHENIQRLAVFDISKV